VHLVIVQIVDYRSSFADVCTICDLLNWAKAIDKNCKIYSIIALF